MNGPESYDLAVIGGGPAGLAAASLAAEHGAPTVLLDEQGDLGGQIYRAITTTPVKRPEILGKDYWRGAALVDRFLASGAGCWRGTTVWNVSRELEVGISSQGQARLVPFRHVILATGAIERPFPIERWTLPGVMGAGGAQILLKSAGLVHDGAVIAGSGPLLWLIAAQYLRAGARIGAILDTTPSKAWPRAALALPGFLLSSYFGKGLGLLAEVRRQVKVIRNVTGLRAVGASHLEAVAYRRGRGPEERLPTELLLLHHGVVPNLNLANATGCSQSFDPVQRCWRPDVDAWGASSVAGVSIAGDGAGISGAEAAEHSGRIAALDALFRLGRIDRDQRDRMAAPWRASLRRAQRGRAFLDLLYQPSQPFLVPPAETVACRCEEVRSAQIRDAVRMGATGPNQVKSFLRCGMGPCQGRLCGPTVTETIADERGVSPAAVGYYRLRPPVKPITLAELASLPRTEDDVKAVFRT